MHQLITTEDFAVLMRSRRRELKLSQAQLAEQIGVSRQWVIDIEKGKPRAELALVLSVLEALGIQLQTKMSPVKAAVQIDAKQGEEKIRSLADAFDFIQSGG